MKLTIGAQIVMPEPVKPNDIWEFGGFLANVTDIIEEDEIAIVENEDSDFFEIEIDRAEKAMINQDDL